MKKRDYEEEAYLDNAATAIKMEEPLEAELLFYLEGNANPRRGLYKKSVQAETGVEICRKRVLKFANADDDYVVIFTRGATEALNLIANGLIAGDDGFGVIGGDKKAQECDARVVVDIESHHANILPWTMRYTDVAIAGELNKKIIHDAEVISLTGVSNVTGEDFSERIKKVFRNCPDAIKGVDAAQMAACGTLDVKALGADFVVFSGHKIGAPMGIGCAVLRRSLAEKLRPLNFGGEMVNSVTIDGSPEWAEVPARLEAGTLNVGGVMALSELLAGPNLREELLRRHQKVSKYVRTIAKEMQGISGVKILAANGSIITFQVDGVHSHDVAQVLADFNVSVRAGYLCAQPYLEHKGWGPVVRASFAYHNLDKRDGVKFIDAVSEIRKVMGVARV